MTAADEILQRLSQIVPLVYWPRVSGNLLATLYRAAKTHSELTLAAATARP